MNQTIQYLDGLGRISQVVQVKGSPSLKDIVMPSVYDGFGRKVFKYQPYADPNIADGSFKPSVLTRQQDFYNSPGVAINSMGTSS